MQNHFIQLINKNVSNLKIKVMKTEKYNLPIYWASYLINSDCSGMEDKEIEQVDKFVTEHKKAGHYFICIDADTENYSFGRFGGLGCDICEYTFDVSKATL
jgi:hypothetical protein